MSYPNHPDKHQEEALFTPHQLHQYLRSVRQFPTLPPPEGVIICCQRTLWEHICSVHAEKLADGTLPGFGGLCIIKGTNHRVGAIGGFGFGAPAVCVFLEHLIAWGVVRFLSIGTAGSLQRNIEIGDLVVCNRAVRDEGTSYHYQAPSKYADANSEITARLVATLDKSKIPYRVGASWTTDAPYRETRAEVLRYQQEGIATVEMEASALFTVGKLRGVNIGAMFTISDSLAGIGYAPR